MNGNRDGHRRANGHANGGPKRIVATYDYVGLEGKVLYQKVRYEPKGFAQRRPDDNGGWTFKLGDVQRVLYRLPELNEADTNNTVYFVEGEKAVDALIAVGLVATCTGEGAGKWRPPYAETLRGRRVAVLADNDHPGRQHARMVADALHGTAAEVRVVTLPALPQKGDVFDYLAAGHATAELEAVVASAPAHDRRAGAATASNANARPPVQYWTGWITDHGRHRHRTVGASRGRVPGDDDGQGVARRLGRVVQPRRPAVAPGPTRRRRTWWARGNVDAAAVGPTA